MLSAILQSIAKKTKRFLIIWTIILVANQIFIFGACFALYCIAAALPHTFAVAAWLNFFAFRSEDDSEKYSKLSNFSLARLIKRFAFIFSISMGILVVFALWQKHSRKAEDGIEVSAHYPTSGKTPQIPIPIVQSPSFAPGAATGRRRVNYAYVIGKAGLRCTSEVPLEYRQPDEEWPQLGYWGHFSCKCTTDTSCVMNNPHVDEDSDEKTRENIAVAPKGTTCDNPVPWNEASLHIGQTWVVVGPVIKVTRRPDVRGNPTWVDVGAAYPNAERLSVVLWGTEKNGSSLIEPSQLEGRRICMVGKITNYKGTSQIVLKYRYQFELQ